MNDQISNVLTQVRLLKSKYDELAAVTGEQFNVFSILGVEADEVRTHTAFLADLLSPQGSHRQEDAFQKLFLKVALNHSGPDEYGDSEPFQVRKEAFTDKGRIDILLEKNDACIVIENKIYAEDQISQLNRYYQYAKTRFSDDNQIKLIYLTLYRSSPDETSLKAVNGQGRDLREDEVIRISYEKHIIDWLEECMKLQEVQRVSPIREIVFQYRDLLKQLTGQSTNKRLSKEMKNILVENKNYKLIPDLEEAILAFKVHVQLEFWGELTNLIREKVDNSRIHNNQCKEASEDNIRHYYQGGRNRLYVGTTFKLDSFFSCKQTEIALRVECGGAFPIYYGFILFEDNRRVDTCDDKRFETLAEKLRDNDFKRGKSWIGCKEPARRFVFPLDYSGENRKHLQDGSSRTESIQEFVTEIVNAVSQLKKNLNQS